MDERDQAIVLFDDFLRLDPEVIETLQPRAQEALEAVASLMRPGFRACGVFLPLQIGIEQLVDDGEIAAVERLVTSTEGLDVCRGHAGSIALHMDLHVFVAAHRPPPPSASGIDNELCVSLGLPSVTTYRADGLAALGDPTRRQIFERLAERPQAVGELASELPISRPAVSQHLKVLKDAQLVIDTRAGNRRIYELDPSGIVLLRTYLDRLWGRALASYKSEVEKRAREAS